MRAKKSKKEESRSTEYPEGTVLANIVSVLLLLGAGKVGPRKDGRDLSRGIPSLLLPQLPGPWPYQGTVVTGSRLAGYAFLHGWHSSQPVL